MYSILVLLDFGKYILIIFGMNFTKYRYISFMFLSAITIDSDVLLWVVWLLIVAFFSVHRRLSPTIYRPSWYNSHRAKWYMSITSLAIVLVSILYIYNIRLPIGQEAVSEDTAHVQIILDVSLSMAADDIEPSRFVAAKDLITQILDVSGDATISLVAFSGIPIVQIPFTKDRWAFLAHLEDLWLTDFPPTIDFLWTALWDALLVGVDRISSRQWDGWHILLITDGDSSIGLDPLDVVEVAREKNIQISTFALWYEEYLLWLDKQWREVIAYIDIATLQEIAQRTWGKFYHMLPDLGTDNFSDIVSDLFSSEKIIVQTVYLALNSILKWMLLVLILIHGSLQLSVYTRLQLFLKNK